MHNRVGVVLTISLLLVSVTGGSSIAQESADTGWKLSGTFNLTHTQSGYSDNWDGDEQGQLTWNSQINIIAERQLTDIMNSRNTLDLEYGQTETQNRNEDGTKTWSRPAKNSDKIDFETVLRFTLDGWIDPYISGRFLSQLTDDRNGDLEWVNPITLTESAGIAKTLLKNEEIDQEWLARLGFATQQHLDRLTPVVTVDGLGNEVTEYESSTTTYAGVELVSEFLSQVINENLRVNSKLIVFQALYNSEKDDLEGPTKNYWQSPDVDWETVFTANITKLLMVNLTARLLYDKEIDTAGRFKETISAGITYVLF